MRTTADRIRHTLLFEIIGLCTCTPLASWMLDKDLSRIGIMSITISVTAMVFNYLYNLVFDKILVALNKPVHVRPAWMRGLHAVLFELSLLTMTVPFVAWWLDMTLWNALIADIGFALFFLVYAFAYNWVYDIVFPMPVPENV
ncbi:PACE efflux transporter [Maridesulfovibrio sp.]|uniref:PACE efflux transporter n=1 Tax=Maridesulfovibrio sp. TaxID=2795000 RepID=UPI0029CA81A2|nr:PACE efflux transporter [Maridesulfovibrio sp.]